MEDHKTHFNLTKLQSVLQPAKADRQTSGASTGGRFLEIDGRLHSHCEQRLAKNEF